MLAWHPVSIPRCQPEAQLAQSSGHYRRGSLKARLPPTPTRETSFYPFVVTPGPGALEMSVHAEWLACKDVCVPEEADLALVLPPGLPASAEQAGLIAAALARVPTSAPFAVTVTAGGTLALLGSGLPGDVTAAEFFPLSTGMVERAPARVIANGRDRVTLRIDPSPGNPQAVTSGVVAITSKSGIVRAYTVSPEPVTELQPAPLILPLLLFALAGGLLLNLMPCVFPILAMKAIAVARLSGSQTRQVRAEAGSYCAGVVSTFVALGVILVILRDAGQAAGWGFQFQSPLFVTVMAWMLFAIGLNLSGVFAISGRWMGRGDALARKGGHGGSFLTGVLAVAVASPCTAPFMGTAIAGALALSDPAAVAVFAAMGLGFSAALFVYRARPARDGRAASPGCLDADIAATPCVPHVCRRCLARLGHQPTIRVQWCAAGREWAGCDRAWWLAIGLCRTPIRLDPHRRARIHRRNGDNPCRPPLYRKARCYLGRTGRAIHDSKARSTAFRGPAGLR